MTIPIGPFPAPRDRAHRARVINVQVEQLTTGQYRLSTPHARGWAEVAGNPVALVRALQGAFREVEVAAYARARGEAYDLDALTSHVPGDPLAALPQRRVRSRNPHRRAAHSPADWTKVGEMVDRTGAVMWRSPGGRMYGEGTKAVQNVITKRRALGLPT